MFNHAAKSASPCLGGNVEMPRFVVRLAGKGNHWKGAGVLAYSTDVSCRRESGNDPELFILGYCVIAP